MHFCESLSVTRFPDGCQAHVAARVDKGHGWLRTGNPSWAWLSVILLKMLPAHKIYEFAISSVGDEGAVDMELMRAAAICALGSSATAGDNDSLRFRIVTLPPLVQLLFAHLPVCLSFCLLVCQSVYLCMCVCVYLSVYFCVYLSVYLSVYVSVCLSVSLFVYLSIPLSAFQSIYLSVYAYQSICLLSVCLPIDQSVCDCLCDRVRFCVSYLSQP